MAKRKKKKGEIRDKLEDDVETIIKSLEELKLYADKRGTKENRTAIAVIMYDLNRFSARVLALLRELGIPLKLDINFLDYYKDDPFGENNDLITNIKLEQK